jgi:hypothetical protein
MRQQTKQLLADMEYDTNDTISHTPLTCSLHDVKCDISHLLIDAEKVNIQHLKYVSTIY